MTFKVFYENMFLPPTKLNRLNLFWTVISISFKSTKRYYQLMQGMYIVYNNIF